jgi:hypothetical protein
MGSKKFSFVFKLVISLTIITLLLVYKTSPREIISSFREVILPWILLSFSLHAFGLIISAIRWQILIAAQGDNVPLSFLIKSYLVGTFFNNFLPTRFGGDVIRIWDSSRYSHSLAKSSATILVERLSGIFVLLLFVLIASLIRLDMAAQLPMIWGALFLGTSGLLLIIVFFLPISQKLIQSLPLPGKTELIKKKIIEFQKAGHNFRHHQSKIALAIFWAFLLQINVILHYYLIGLSLKVSIPLIDYFIFVPIVLLLLTIPVTINGLGLREGAYIEIFAYYGISASVAFAFSLIDVIFMLLLGIIGGIVYIIRK